MPTALERLYDRRKPRAQCANKLCREDLPRAYDNPFNLCPSCQLAWRLGLKAGVGVAAAAGFLIGAIVWLSKLNG